MNKEQFQSLRSELKELALMIKIKNHNKRAAASISAGGKQKLLPEPVWKFKFSIWRARYEYRHKHIILSLARGKTREQIERPKENNLPDETYITKLVEAYKDVEQTVCVSS